MPIRQIAACRQKLLALPTKAARALLNKSEPTEVQRILHDEVYEALNELKGYGPAQFAARRRQRFRTNGGRAKEAEAVE